LTAQVLRDVNATRSLAPQALRIFLRKVKGRLTQRGTAEERVRRYCTRLPKIVPSPIFVKVGANDGVTGDPVSDIFLSETRWKGLLIEPVPFCFQRLAANFSDSQRFSLEQVAIGQSEGIATFYYVDLKASETIPDLPDWFDQLGSFEKHHIVKHLGGALEPLIIEEPVPVCTLCGLLMKHGISKVHFLHIDAEGYDYEIFKTLDLEHDAFAAIFIEHKHLPLDQRMAMLKRLRAHSYRVDNCGGDYFAVHKSSPLRRLAWDTAAPL